MGYCEIEDVKAIMTEEDLKFYTNSDEEVLSAIEDASAEIDAYLTGRFEVPLKKVPAIIKKICADITVWNLVSRKQRTEAPQVILERYKAAVKLLEKLAKGEITLAVERPHVTSFRGRVYSPSQVFTRESMEGF
jgi:phage gp36-like protein